MQKITLILAFVFATVAYGQEEMEVKGDGYGEKEMIKSSGKRVFINTFKVNYGVMYQDQEVQTGGRTVGGGFKGDAKATLTLGLKGVDGNDLVKITDEIYEAFVSRLQQDGYTMVGIEEAVKSESFADYERKKGGIASETNTPGALSISPSNFEYMVKRVTNKGKEVTSSFMTFYNKLSKSLDGAIVMNITYTIPFAEPGKDFKTGLINVLGGAGVSAATELKLVPSIMALSFKKLGEGGYVYFSLKNEHIIEGVLERKVYKESAVGEIDWGSSAGMYTFFSVDDVVRKTMQSVVVDKATYTNSVKNAIMKFNTLSLDNMVKYNK